MTKREVLNGLLAMAEGRETEVTMADVKAFAESALKTMDNRSSKETKLQKENAVLREKIVEFLGTVEVPLTIEDIRTGCEAVSEFSSNKVNALVKQLKDNKTVVRTVEKGRAYFALA